MAGLQRGAKPPWERKPAGVVTQADVVSTSADVVDTRFPVGTDGRPNYLTPKGSVVPLLVDVVGTGLHSNADFESVTVTTPDVWDAGWNSGGSFTTETTDVLFGTRSATAATTAGANFQILMSDVFTVAGGDQLTIGAWAHAVTGSPKLQIGILSAASGSPNFFDGVSIGQGSDSFALAATFTKYAKTFPVPAGHTAARLYMRFDPTAAEAASSRVDFTTSSRTGASTPMLPGNSWAKESCRAATTGNVATLAGGTPNPVDTVSLVVGDRVLVKEQTSSAQNGIYTVTVVGSGSNGTWVRASDASASAQLAGAVVGIREGNLGGRQYATLFRSVDTLGTTPYGWQQVVLNGYTAPVDLIMGTGSVGTGTFRDSVDSRVVAAAGAWQTASLAANWADAGGGNETAQYRLGAGNTVEIKGIISRSVSTVTAGTTIFTMAVGWRPATIQFFPSYATTAGFASTVFIVMKVDSSGNVSCISSALASGNLVGLHGSIYPGV